MDGAFLAIGALNNVLKGTVRRRSPVTLNPRHFTLKALNAL